MAISEKDKETYAAQGFLILRQAFAKTRIEALLKGIERLIDKGLAGECEIGWIDRERRFLYRRPQAADDARLLLRRLRQDRPARATDPAAGDGITELRLSRSSSSLPDLPFSTAFCASSIAWCALNGPLKFRIDPDTGRQKTKPYCEPYRRTCK